MGIPKRGSRLIVVEDQQYRWLMRGWHRYIGNPHPCPTITVQIVHDRPGQVLQCHLVNKVTADGGEPDIDGGEPWLTTKITPVDVEKVIRTGLQMGWNPMNPGAAFELKSVNLQDYFSRPEYVGKFPV